MTIKQTLDEIKALGLRARYQSEWKEYQIDYKGNLPYADSPTTYHTSDANDALVTARMMASSGKPEPLHKMEGMTEQGAVKRVLMSLIKAGMSIDVEDGEGILVSRSTDHAECMSKMFTTLDDILYCYDRASGKYRGFVHFIYGNSPDEVVNDYHVDLKPFVQLPQL